MLFWLLILALVLFLIVKGSKKNTNQPGGSDYENNIGWARFIQSYKAVAKTKSEQQLLDKMLADLQTQGFPLPPELKISSGGTVPVEPAAAQSDASTAQPAISPAKQSAAAAQQLPAFTVEAKQPDAPAKSIDNAVLLLYFGAFLGIASAGLFVAVGGLSGIARTMVVFIVSLLLYVGGLWLHQSYERFKPAGLAFVGIGMAIAPLVGLAAYQFVMDKTGGPAVWFVTSLFCFVLYGYAFLVLQNALIGYMLLAAFVSMFESGVAILQAPVYMYAWGLALSGLVLAVISRFNGSQVKLSEPSGISSRILLPASIAVSALFVSQNGTGQLAITCGIAALFYALQAWFEAENRNINILASQIFASVAVGIGAFSFWDSITYSGLALGLFALLEALTIAFIRRARMLHHDVITVAGATAALSIALMLEGGTILLAGIGTALLTCILLTAVKKRVDLFYETAAILVFSPILIGQFAFSQHPSAAVMALSTLVTAAVLLLLIGLFRFYKLGREWVDAADISYVCAVALAVSISFFAPAWVVFGIAIVAAITFVCLAETDDNDVWPQLAGVILLTPLARYFSDWRTDTFAAATLLAWAGNVLLSLRYRLETLRWVSTALWLLLPLAVGGGAFGFRFGPAEFAWSYVLAMIGLMISRTIARGKLLVSSRVPMTSFMSSASQAYSVGYVFAACLSIVISLYADNSQQHTTVILGVLTLAAVAASFIVENQPEIMAFIPLLLQLAVFSLLRPINNADAAGPYVLVSSISAVGGYIAAIPGLLSPEKSERARIFRQASLLAAFVAPFSFILIGNFDWQMPVTLAMASLAALHYNWEARQSLRELSVSGLVAAVMGLLLVNKVENVQVYTHILAAMFGGFAYWRAKMLNREVSDQYLYAMLGTATVPLLMQALGGSAGGVYGWWLLIEQVGFMLLGMAIGRKFVTLWGLYVAVGAVLYQLRGLGWAMLTVLAVFVIGIAMYQLNKQNKH